MAALLGCLSSSALSPPPPPPPPSTSGNRVAAAPLSTASVPIRSRLLFSGNGDDRRSFLLRMARVSVERNPMVLSESETDGIGVVSIHHVGLLCQNLEKSLDFYQNLLGLKINEARPHDKLPYRGAWLWVGSEMIHLMELPNPDPLTGRPEHGGRDRHACIAIRDVSKLKAIFDKAGISYTLSKSGRPAIFARDPDGNALEFTQID